MRTLFKKVLVVIASCAFLASCSDTPSPQAALPGVDSSLQATVVLIDQRVRTTAGANDTEIGLVSVLEEKFVQLLERNVIPSSFSYAYADSDNDGIVDDGNVLFSGNDDKVCLTFGENLDTPGRYKEGDCSTETPLTGPTNTGSTVPTLPAENGAEPVEGEEGASPTSSRPVVIGPGAVATRTDQAVANDLAGQIAREADALARLDGIPPYSTSLLEEIRATLPNGATLLFTDIDQDGLADNTEISVVSTLGVGACLTYPDDTTPSITDNIC